MKTQKSYFVFAVMIAILVPVAMGSIYFISMYNKKGYNNYVSNVEKREEILILGDIELDGLQGVKDTREYLLNVKYTYGDEKISSYDLYVDNITLPDSIDAKNIKWELYMFDTEENKYLQLSFGNMENIKNKKLKISPVLQIGKGQTQKFMFKYYNVEEMNNLKFDFKGNVNIE